MHVSCWILHVWNTWTYNMELGTIWSSLLAVGIYVWLLRKQNQQINGREIVPTDVPAFKMTYVWVHPRRNCTFESPNQGKSKNSINQLWLISEKQKISAKICLPRKYGSICIQTYECIYGVVVDCTFSLATQFIARGGTRKNRFLLWFSTWLRRWWLVHLKVTLNWAAMISCATCSRETRNSWLNEH